MKNSLLAMMGALILSSAASADFEVFPLAPVANDGTSLEVEPENTYNPCYAAMLVDGYKCVRDGLFGFNIIPIHEDIDDMEVPLLNYSEEDSYKYGGHYTTNDAGAPIWNPVK